MPLGTSPKHLSLLTSDIPPYFSLTPLHILLWLPSIFYADIPPKPLWHPSTSASDAHPTQQTSDFHSDILNPSASLPPVFILTSRQNPSGIHPSPLLMPIRISPEPPTGSHPDTHSSSNSTDIHLNSHPTQQTSDLHSDILNLSASLPPVFILTSLQNPSGIHPPPLLMPIRISPEPPTDSHPDTHSNSISTGFRSSP